MHFLFNEPIPTNQQRLPVNTPPPPPPFLCFRALAGGRGAAAGRSVHLRGRARETVPRGKTLCLLGHLQEAEALLLDALSIYEDVLGRQSPEARRRKRRNSQTTHQQRPTNQPLNRHIVIFLIPSPLPPPLVLLTPPLVLSISPQAAVTKNNLAVLLTHLGRLDEADTLLTQTGADE